jgi:NADPH:quinone reductase-like Zn-dependent oxidoreductase
MPAMNTRIVVREYGGPEVLQEVSEPLRPPKPGEVRVKVQRAGVALADLMRRRNLYPMSPTPPFTPGYDAVGLVDAVGDGVDAYRPGESVGAFFNGTGGYAAYLYVATEDLYKVPAALDPAKAAALLLNYVTAYQMLHRFANVKKGDTLLIHGASGGVGTALLELGRLAGARMLGTASASKHHVLAQYGAIPIEYRTEDFVEVVNRLAPEGVQAVFDPIGGENWERSLQTLCTNGTFVGYGYTSVLGGKESEDWVKDWAQMSGRTQEEGGQAIHLYSITSLRVAHPEWFREDLSLLFTWLAEGKIDPLISHQIPLREAAQAHRIVEASQAIGKVLLVPEGS